MKNPISEFLWTDLLVTEQITNIEHFTLFSLHATLLQFVFHCHKFGIIVFFLSDFTSTVLILNASKLLFSLSQGPVCRMFLSVPSFVVHGIHHLMLMQ